MTNMELLETLGGIKSTYIVKAQTFRSAGKVRKSYSYLRPMAAILVLVMLLTAFIHTAPGAAAVAFIQEKIESLIEALFPPKTMEIILEGLESEGNYEADGSEPEVGTPGFAIYYDVDNYTMVKEGAVTYIRPYMKPITREEIMEECAEPFTYLTEEERERQIQALMDPQPDPTLPPCEIEIVHLDMPYLDAANQAKAELLNAWQVTELSEENRITFNLLGGQQWDSPVEDWDFFQDGQNGCFRVIRRYFFDATEGHGMRFAAMVRTFAVIAESEG